MERICYTGGLIRVGTLRCVEIFESEDLYGAVSELKLGLIDRIPEILSCIVSYRD